MDESQSTAFAEPPVDNSLLEKLLHNRLSESEARQFASENPECITFTLLALQQRLACSQQSTGANTPSSVIPPYEKPPVKPKPPKTGRKKRGGQPGHAGRTRDHLSTPDRTREHRCKCCRECNGELTRTGKTRSRRSEDIPEDLKPVITEDVVHRDYCPKCKKRVKPKLPDVLPNCTLGNRTLVLATL